MAALPKPCLGLILLVVLGAQAQVSVQPDFQQDKFLGRWFTAGLASNSSWLQEKKGALSMCTTEVALSADGGLTLTSTYLRKDQCETRIKVLQPARVPGAYSYHNPSWGKSFSVSVAETNYDTYALLLVKGTEGSSQEFLMATLYSRTPTLSAELKEKFVAFCEAQGFTEDTFVYPFPTDKCLKKEQD